MPRGSRPGERRGGRKKGTSNRATAAKAAAIAASGVTPLDYPIRVMRNPKNETHVRLEAAKAAAPYVHPRLAPVAQQPETDHVPLAERILAYAREDAIKASEGKVVEMPTTRD